MKVKINIVESKEFGQQKESQKTQEYSFNVLGQDVSGNKSRNKFVDNNSNKIIIMWKYYDNIVIIILK